MKLLIGWFILTAPIIIIVFVGDWLTAEGEEVLIRDMTTQHIKNCIAMLQKHGDEEKYISIFEQELEKRKDNE